MSTLALRALIAATALSGGWACAQDSASLPKPAARAEPASPAEETSVGGYGEIGYNRYLDASGADQADLKRFVIFLSHRFDDRWSVYSEVEWEHAVASADDQGESEIEQAWLGYSISNGLSLKAGLFLMPLGILNQSHEPPVFFGVERNEVETRIIPSTWREGGIGLYGATASGWAWDAGLVTGFDLAKMDDAGYPLASSHQELQLAKASDLSVYGTLNYQGSPGLKVGLSGFVGNTLQGNADHVADPRLPDFSGLDGLLTLGDVHARWQHGDWDLEGLLTAGGIQQAQEIDGRIRSYDDDTANGGSFHPYVPGAFYGWLVQAGFTAWRHGDLTLTPFLRLEGYDTQWRMPDGFKAESANADQVLTAGASLKPISAIVVKADCQWFRNGSSRDRVNLGLGWMF